MRSQIAGYVFCLLSVGPLRHHVLITLRRGCSRPPSPRPWAHVTCRRSVVCSSLPHTLCIRSQMPATSLSSTPGSNYREWVCLCCVYLSIYRRYHTNFRSHSRNHDLSYEVPKESTRSNSLLECLSRSCSAVVSNSGSRHCSK